MYAKMKLKDAIQIIEKREKMNRNAQKELKKKIGISFGRADNGKESGLLTKTNEIRTNLVHVQSIFPYQDVLALKERAGEATIRDAISKAVHHYLKCIDDE